MIDRFEADIFRRHYTRRELDALISDVRRLVSCERLTIMSDVPPTDYYQLGITMYRRGDLAVPGFEPLTTMITSREMAIALTAMGLVPRAWDLEREHGERVVDKMKHDHSTITKRRVSQKAFGRRKGTTT